MSFFLIGQLEERRKGKAERKMMMFCENYRDDLRLALVLLTFQLRQSVISKKRAFSLERYIPRSVMYCSIRDKGKERNGGVRGVVGLYARYANPDESPVGNSRPNENRD